MAKPRMFASFIWVLSANVLFTYSFSIQRELSAIKQTVDSLKNGILHDKLTEGTNEDTLVFVQAMWRHGDRNPTRTFKNDTNQEDTWHLGWGQLTPIGMEQHVALGQKLANKYISKSKFLSPTYDAKEIYVRSTDVNRTIISAISNFIGFYCDTSQANSDYPGMKDWPAGFVPIPIHSDFPKYSSNCNRLDSVYDLLEASPEFKNYSSKHDEFLEQVYNLTGTKYNYDNLWSLYDVLFIEKLKERKTPDWATPDFMERLRNVSIELNGLYDGDGVSPYMEVDLSTELRKLKGGPLLDHLISNIKRKISCLKQNGKKKELHYSKNFKYLKALDVEENTTKKKNDCTWGNNLKYYIISAHDSTLSALASTLVTPSDPRFSNAVPPSYSTAVTLELWKNGTTNNFYVKLLLWPPQQDSYEDITSKITGCENSCTFDQFVQRSQKYIPEPNFFEYCQNTVSQSNNGGIMNSVSFFHLCFIVITTFFGAFVTKF